MTNAIDFNTGRFDNYKLSINDSRLEKIKNADNKEEAIHMGIFDKIKDMILGTHKAEALSALYELTHRQENTLDSACAINKMKSFATLKNSLSDTCKANLSAHFSSNLDGSHNFHIKLLNKDNDSILNETFQFGEPNKELASIRQLPLNNDIDFLDQKSVEEQGLEQTLKSVFYQPKQPGLVSRDQKDIEMQGVVPFNQTRLNLHLLEKETLIKMSDDSVLAQKWVAEQMKIAAHITTLTSSLQEVLFSDFPAEGNIDGHWTTEANNHLQNIMKEVTLCAAQEFDNSVKSNGSLRNYA